MNSENVKKRKKEYDIIVNLDKKSKNSCFMMIGGIEVLCLIVQLVSNNTNNIIAMHLSFAMIVHIPAIFCIMYFSLFRICVKGNIISVRNWRGKKFCFSLEEINSVVWRENVMPNGGVLYNITIKSKKGKVSFDTLLNNSEKLATFIKKNVEREKIKEIKNNFLHE